MHLLIVEVQKPKKPAPVQSLFVLQREEGLYHSGYVLKISLPSDVG
jgi:hypothetical protein